MHMRITLTPVFWERSTHISSIHANNMVHHLRELALPDDLVDRVGAHDEDVVDGPDGFEERGLVDEDGGGEDEHESALTTWREITSAVVLVWHWVTVCTTRSIREGSGRFGGWALEVELRPFGPGEGGGEDREMGWGFGFVSTKKE